MLPTKRSAMALARGALAPASTPPMWSQPARAATAAEEDAPADPAEFLINYAHRPIRQPNSRLHTPPGIRRAGDRVIPPLLLGRSSGNLAQQTPCRLPDRGLGLRTAFPSQITYQRPAQRDQPRDHRLVAFITPQLIYVLEGPQPEYRVVRIHRLARLRQLARRHPGVQDLDRHLHLGARPSLVLAHGRQPRRHR
jgi:hypothetical protein